MTYPELINEYLDGKLAGTPRERELFDGLAEQPEWREEMALQLQMEQAMRRDLTMVAVPPAATNAIFSRIRFAPSEQRSMIAETPSAIRRFVFGKGAEHLGVYSALRIATIAILLSGSAFVLYSNLKSNTSTTPPVRANGLPPQMPPVSDSAVAPTIIPTSSLPTTPPIPNAIADRVQKERTPSPATASSNDAEKLIHVTDVRQTDIANEPIISYLNVGNFYAVDYLTREKIIGVFESGKIFCSEDGGHAWMLQSSGTTTDLYGVNFIDTLNGAAVGGHGTVLRTSDAGRHWRQVISGTDAKLIAVRYVTADTLYACGDGGSIIRSTDAGNVWTRQTSGTSANFFRMQWKNGEEGEIRGAHGIALTTHDAGVTWNIVK